MTDEPLHQVQCPSCSVTIRARMADRTEPPPPAAILTGRQAELLQHLADGRTVDEAAPRMLLTPSSARSYCKQLRVRIGARSQAHAVAIGMRAGVIR